MQAQRARAENYRREASRLRQEAEMTLDPKIRLELLAMAEKYEALAVIAERISSRSIE
jgi:hypothetical protein